VSVPERFLDILVVDDDPEVLQQLEALLPARIDDHDVAWEFVGEFDEALVRLRRRRYDILVSDIYRDRAGQKNIEAGDMRARDLVDEIRQRRFCPIVLFTDGQVPEGLVHRPFVWQGDKSAADLDAQLVARIRDAVASGLPTVARELHDELDAYAGSYVWRFLAERWEDLKSRHGLDTELLAKIIRRRAAIQFGRLDQENPDGPIEREHGDPVDYYIYPPTSDFLRLGEIIRRKATHEIRVVLTPHCFLVKQPGSAVPRANHVLTVRTVGAEELRAAWTWDKKSSEDDLRRRTSFPAAKLNPPEGRFYFLPGFLDIPDVYCDLLQLESLAYETVADDFDRLAVLDAPYGEALQAGISRLYGAVGVPVLNPDRVRHLGPAATGA
jgi:CheY-like chemotaxis protein